ncbi:MAG: inositol monophosphatase family protein [Betaproteobacteria bacterium]|nr:inositol monophosphatase family protein [Betaproteobacteria bacterium]
MPHATIDRGVIHEADDVCIEHCWPRRHELRGGSVNHAGPEVATAALLAEASAVVRAVAAEQVMPRYRKVAHRRKDDGTLCTEADMGAQRALIERLQAIAPYPVLGEEMTAGDQLAAWDRGAEGLWCVDPIDGTSNFVHEVPYFAISVALMRAGRSVLGVVYAPVTDEMFTAHRGGGSYLNGERIHAGQGAPELRSAMANVDFKRIPKPLGAALVAGTPYCSHRSLGAATLEWCYLAAGRLDVYVHGGQKLWDYAAGTLMLEEAGGMVGTLEHEDFWASAPWRRSVVAARHPTLYASWRQWIDATLRPAVPLTA